MRRLLALLLPVLLLVAGTTTSQAQSPTLYVCNQGEATISVIDMESQTVETTVDLKERGFSPNAKPHHVVAEPDGEYWYVTLIGENTILKFNRNNEIVDRTSSFEVPGLMALHDDSDRLYVGRSMSAVDPPQSIGVLDRSSMTVEEQVDTFFPRPHPIAVETDGEHAFVASLATNQLMGLDTASGETTLTRLGGDTQTLVQFALTPDGSTLIAGGSERASCCSLTPPRPRRCRSPTRCRSGSSRGTPSSARTEPRPTCRTRNPTPSASSISRTRP